MFQAIFYSFESVVSNSNSKDSFFIKNFAILLSIGSIFVTFICLAYNYSFFSALGVNFFFHSSFTDIYQTPMQNGVLTIAVFSFGVSWLATLCFSFLYLIFKGVKPTEIKSSNVLNIAQYLVLSIFVILFLYLIPPSDGVDMIKSGYKKRYDIVLSSKERFNCQIIVGGTSSALFTWDSKQHVSRVINKSKISYLSLRIEQPPVFKLKKLSRHETQEQFKLREIEHNKSKQLWLSNLNKNCDETLDFSLLQKIKDDS